MQCSHVKDYKNHKKNFEGSNKILAILNTSYILSNHFHEILNLNSRIVKREFHLLISLMTLYNGDVKCDVNCFFVSIFLYFI